MKELFVRVSSYVTKWTGSPVAFVLAFLFVFGWALLGSYFEWSTSHSLFINTATTITTFLMVFLIQGSQNREAMAVQIKLDALIDAIEKADSRYIDIENSSIEELEEHLERLRNKVNTHIEGT